MKSYLFPSAAIAFVFLFSACNLVTASDASPEPIPDLQPTVEALVNQRLAEMQQEATSKAEAEQI